MIKCATCGASCDDKPLYRANKKGDIAIWKCEDCLHRNIDTELKNISNIISGKKR